MNAFLRLLSVGIVASYSMLSSLQATELLWGDTHVHTSYSFDAFLNGNLSADPEAAFRYAKGLPVIHPFNRTRVRIGTPLDFLVIADHAEFYGGIRDIYNEGIQDPDPNILESIVYWWRTNAVRDAIDEGTGPQYFANLLPTDQDPVVAAREWGELVTARTPPGADISATNAWKRLGTIVDAYDEPGKFTAFLGWEWSSIPGGANLHRVVISDADGTTGSRFMPLSTAESAYPEDLWTWLEKTSQETGVRFIAIPHNSNISKGQMFSETTLRGDAINTDYARMRRKWEPVAEITQIKGDSETHPSLSPDDPFADFELYPWYIQQVRTTDYDPQPGDYVRSALKRGLAFERTLGENPFKLGVIGSTDTHTGLSSAEEPNFWGKMAYDSIPENKQGRMLALGPTGWTMQAGGLAAVWAAENTRTAILDAFERREVYATTGPRIRLRFFGGFEFSQADIEAREISEPGYARGVPMGGDLPAASSDQAPGFLVQVLKDPKSANLDRIQIVKGWVDTNGATYEKVYNVAWSDGREIDGNGDPALVGDTVDRKSVTWTDDIGAAQLSAFWQDPDFDADQAAFYYVRTLEIPTPRHSLYDAIALGLEEATEGPSVIQERAYSSAIWYTP